VTVAGWLALCRFLEGPGSFRFLVPVAFFLLLSWVGWEIATMKVRDGGRRSLTYQEAHSPQPRTATAKTPPNFPGEYDPETKFSELGIPFNGFGWERSTGDVTPCISLFVDNPEFIELEVGSTVTNITELDCAHLQAKIGLEFLEFDFRIETPRGWKIRFHGPKKSRYQKGIQPVFIAFPPSTELASTTTPWKLFKVRWRENAF
jgi:hypothetical protein